jgi:hypothetical protein
VLVPLGLGTTTNSDKHTPKPGTTLVEPSQLAETHWPWRSTLVELEHARQLLDPGPEQLEQVESQDWHVPLELSKYWVFVQVGRQRPLTSTGRLGGQVVHWLKAPPEQDEQSGWQVTQLPEEEKVEEGHEETQRPLEASWLFRHETQKLAEPEQVPHDESQAKISQLGDAHSAERRTYLCR